jgi:hypothetical protein
MLLINTTAGLLFFSTQLLLPSFDVQGPTIMMAGRSVGRSVGHSPCDVLFTSIPTCRAGEIKPLLGHVSLSLFSSRGGGNTEEFSSGWNRE